MLHQQFNYCFFRVGRGSPISTLLKGGCFVTYLYDITISFGGVYFFKYIFVFFLFLRFLRPHFSIHVFISLLFYLFLWRFCFEFGGWQGNSSFPAFLSELSCSIRSFCSTPYYPPKTYIFFRETLTKTWNRRTEDSGSSQNKNRRLSK